MQPGLINLLRLDGLSPDGAPSHRWQGGINIHPRQKSGRLCPLWRPCLFVAGMYGVPVNTGAWCWRLASLGDSGRVPGAAGFKGRS